LSAVAAQQHDRAASLWSVVAYTPLPGLVDSTGGHGKCRTAPHPKCGVMFSFLHLILNPTQPPAQSHLLSGRLHLYLLYLHPLFHLHPHPQSIHLYIPTSLHLYISTSQHIYISTSLYTFSLHLYIHLTLYIYIYIYNMYISIHLYTSKSLHLYIDDLYTSTHLHMYTN